MKHSNSGTRLLVIWSVAALIVVQYGFSADIAHKESTTKESTTAIGSRFHEGQWPFCPPVRPALPEVAEVAWPANPIDHFIAARLEEAGLRPGPAVGKAALLRRVTYDLTGLPPTTAELDAFLNDDSGQAYQQVVDRLLASPRFGERWAQHWLDLVRYAETEGFKADVLRANAYRYRDYVIDSFNSDRPFDEFIRQQLAGDELEPDDPQAVVATGFLRLYADEDNAANLLQRRQEILNDVTDTTGLAFLGLTIGCAQCHDHKFDEILQTDYYRLQAVFACLVERDDVPLTEPAKVLAHRRGMASWEAATAEIRQEMGRLLEPARHALENFHLEKYEPSIVACYLKPANQRSPYEEQIARMVKWRFERAFNDEAIAKKLTPADRRKLAALQERLAEFDALKPEPLPRAMSVADVGELAPPTYFLEGGNWKRPGAVVQPGFPEFLGAATPEEIAGAEVHCQAPTTGRRTQLAQWLTRPDHPLTARVIVNRLWQHHFGRGIVATPSDFGSQGEPPSHPELLDWLAVELMENGWSLKHIHRLIVTSAAYQLSSLADPSDPLTANAMNIDRENKLLWRGNRRRLEGEALRDAMLQTAGKLNLRMHGPSAHPVLPQGVSDRYAWEPDQDPAQRNRRSIYVLAKRNLRYPLFEAFDQPDLHQSCARRAVTVTAPQSLAMLNSELTLEMARYWAETLVAEHGGDVAELVRAAYRAAYSRTATEEEIGLATTFLNAQSTIDSENIGGNWSLAKPEGKASGSRDEPGGDAVSEFCHALFNSNEFITVD